MPHDAQSAASDSGLIGLTIIARFLGLASDPARLRHELGLSGTAGIADLLRAARSIGLKARSVSSTWERLQRTSLPALARDTEGRYVVIAAIREGQVLLQDPLEHRPRELSRTAFESTWSGGLILLTRREPGPGQDDGRFGFGWFVAAVQRYRHLFAEVLLASFFLQLFALLTPLFFQVVVDKVLLHTATTTLDVLAVGLLALAVFDVLLAGLRTYVFSHTTNRVDVLLGSRVFGHLLHLPLAYFEARRVGDSIARVRELENIRSFLTGSALTLVVDLFFTLVFFAVLYLYSPVLTAIVGAAIPGYVLLSILITPPLRRRLEERFNRGAENQAFLVESVNGIGTLKAMAVEPLVQRRWEDKLAAYVAASFRATQLANVAGQMAAFIDKIMVVLILWVGASAVMGGDLTVGQLVAFNMIAARISGPILRLVHLWQDFQQAGISVRRLGDILDTPTERGVGRTTGTLPALRGSVCFEHVGFRYAPGRPEALRDIRLDVEAGETIGIVGRSGSGKSTLAKLIQRLYVPESGRILIDGIDLALVDPAWLRRQVGVVLQENFLFNRSVRENIALIDPALPMERVVRAARLAGAHDFILALPEGYDTVVGEQGTSLSGGQRQRIAIARALVADPRILIFDEATSALDYESERIVQANMRAIAADRTVFIIAHRLTAVQHADRILVVDRGRVVEQGSHGQLLQSGGVYASLWRMQAGGGSAGARDGAERSVTPPAPHGITAGQRA